MFFKKTKTGKKVGAFISVTGVFRSVFTKPSVRFFEAVNQDIPDGELPHYLLS
jgi:hypothetical protein